MTKPILAKADEVALMRLINHLPHALILKTEPGLDDKGVVEHIVASEGTDKSQVSPEPGKKNISVLQIRDLIYSLRTQVSRRRIVIISPSDQMTEESQNALLKILEEPADNTHFVLVTNQLSSLLPTIISRCETFQLHRTSKVQDAQTLKDAKINEQSKQQILFLASGRPLLIRKLAEDSELFEKYRTYAANSKIILSGPSYQSLKIIHKYSASREEAMHLIDVLLTMVKFQVNRNGFSEQIRQLMLRLEKAELSSKSNGNIKLALLNVVL